MKKLIFSGEIYRMMDELRKLMLPFDNIIYAGGSFSNPYLSNHIAIWNGVAWKEISKHEKARKRSNFEEAMDLDHADGDLW